VLQLLASVAFAAHQINRNYGRVDLLVLNAGVFAHAYALTEDRMELSWQVNHVAGLALVLNLMPSLLSAPAPRIVLVASSGHYTFDWAKWGYGDFNVSAFPMPQDVYNPVTAYGASKAANVLTARELARQFGPRGVQAFSVHPGFVRTGFATPREADVQTASAFVQWFLLYVVAPSTALFWRLMPTVLSASQGAGVVLYPCLSAVADKDNGAYFSVGPLLGTSSPATQNMTTAKALWDRTEMALLFRKAVHG